MIREVLNCKSCESKISKLCYEPMAIIRIPPLIDPHCHLVEPNANYWQAVSRGAMKAGYGALQIMSDLEPPLVDKLSYAYYDRTRQNTAIPFYLTAAGTASNLEQIKQLHNISALKVWLGTGPPDLVVTQEETLRQILLSTDKIVMIHAEDEMTVLRNYALLDNDLTIDNHSEIFNRQVAIRAVVKAISAAKETGRRIYICHISTAEEVELIRAAKGKGLRVYAEVAPHHLFLVEDEVARLGLLAKVNPPLRTKNDQRALWEALRDGTIDTIGSDTYLWRTGEKEKDYEESPSGLPNLELVLPLLLTAVREGRLTLERFIDLTSTNPAKIFSISKPTSSLFVDIDTPRTLVSSLTDWQPYESTELVGWPVHTREAKVVDR